MSGRALKRRKLSDDDLSYGSSNEFEGFGQSDNCSSSSSEHLSSSRSSSASTRNSLSETNGNSSEDITDSKNEIGHGMLRRNPATVQTAKPRNQRPATQNRLELKNYRGNLSKSELLRLQVDELLEQVRLPDRKSDNEIDTTLRSLKKLIENISGRSTLSVRIARFQ